MQHQWRALEFREFELEQLYQVLRLRQIVFVVEQNSLYLDLDGRDQRAVHMLCESEGSLLAYQRCLPPGIAFAESALGRIVVDPAARGLQLGRELVNRGIVFNQQRWPGCGIRINAQLYLREFYESCGFVVQGEEFDEDGIPHVQMLLQR